MGEGKLFMVRKRMKGNWDNLEPQKSGAVQFITYVDLLAEATFQ